MNRAWIPAGALAGVSVAGLIALGPLTDSLGTNVNFPDAVPVTATASSKAPQSVPVAVTRKGVGQTSTDASYKLSKRSRGGEASISSTSSTDGFVSNRRVVTPKAPTSSTTSSTPPAKATTPPKKTPAKRQQEIGTTGEFNDSSGLASGSSGSTGLGEQSATPGSAGP